MLADYAERMDLAFTPPDAATAERLRDQLPNTATVSNPLDYTTPIWGMPEKTEPVFDTLFAQGHDVAVIVQDYPAPGLDESKQHYRNDTLSFIAAASRHTLAAAVCSTIPENLDRETRDFLVAQGVAPMQCIEHCMAAIAAGAWHGERRADIAAHPPPPLAGQEPMPHGLALLDEAEAKRRLKAGGIPVPEGRVGSAAEAPALADALGYPVALKMMSAMLPHKTEAGAVRLGLASAAAMAKAVERMTTDVAAYDADALSGSFLVERMVDVPVAELMVSIRRDRQFGLALTLASGGVLVELLADVTTVLLPASRRDIARALGRLKVSRLLTGYRGRPAADREALLDVLERLAVFAADASNAVAEIEINPLFVGSGGCCAVDVLMHQVPAAKAAGGSAASGQGRQS